MGRERGLIDSLECDGSYVSSRMESCVGSAGGGECVVSGGVF